MIVIKAIFNIIGGLAVLSIVACVGIVCFLGFGYFEMGLLEKYEKKQRSKVTTIILSIINFVFFLCWFLGFIWSMSSYK